MPENVLISKPKVSMKIQEHATLNVKKTVIKHIILWILKKYIFIRSILFILMATFH